MISCDILHSTADYSGVFDPTYPDFESHRSGEWEQQIPVIQMFITMRLKSIYDFSDIGINDVGWVSSPVNLDLFARFTVDVHGCTVFLLVLLDMKTELELHEWFIAREAALLKVFCPQELFIDAITEQLFADAFIVWHSLLRRISRFPCV